MSATETKAKLRQLGPPDALFYWIEKKPTRIDQRKDVFVLFDVVPFMFLNIEIQYIHVKEPSDSGVTKHYYPFIDGSNFGMYPSFEEAEIAVIRTVRTIMYSKISCLEVELHKAFDHLKKKNYKRYLRYSKGVRLTGVLTI